jgi:hypothetical protein
VTNLRGAHWLPLECKAPIIQLIRAWLQSKNSDGGYAIAL